MKKREYKLRIEDDNGDFKYYGMFSTAKKAWESGWENDNANDFAVSKKGRIIIFDGNGNEKKY